MSIYTIRRRIRNGKLGLLDGVTNISIFFAFFGLVYDHFLTYRTMFLPKRFMQVRLQMICVLLGGLAIMSVRRNKRLSASLFDQRKQGMDAGNNQTSSSSKGSKPDKKRSSYISENDEEIEFTPMMNQQQQQQQERVPLVLNGESRGGSSSDSYPELEVV
jgi:hypothetical protein